MVRGQLSVVSRQLSFAKLSVRGAQRQKMPYNGQLTNGQIGLTAAELIGTGGQLDGGGMK